MAGLLYNPLFNASMGLLAAGGPSRFPVGFGQALNQGLLQAQGADVAGQELGFRGREADQRDQLFALKQQAIAQEQEQAARQRAAMERLGGLLSPEQQTMLAAGVPPSEILKTAGLLGSAKENTPTSVREYEFAVGQGFRGTYQDWIRAKGESGRSSVEVTVGGESFKPQTPEGKAAVDLAELSGRLVSMTPGTPEYDSTERAIESLRDSLLPKGDQTVAGYEAQQRFFEYQVAAARSEYALAVEELREKPMDLGARNRLEAARQNLKTQMANLANIKGEPADFLVRGMPIPGVNELILGPLLGSDPAAPFAPNLNAPSSSAPPSAPIDLRGVQP